MDLAVQAGHVTSLGVVYKLVLPDARSRATTVYMTTVFVGGAAGSLAAAAAYGARGWPGTVLVAAGPGRRPRCCCGWCGSPSRPRR